MKCSLEMVVDSMMNRDKGSLNCICVSGDHDGLPTRDCWRDAKRRTGI